MSSPKEPAPLDSLDSGSGLDALEALEGLDGLDDGGDLDALAGLDGTREVADPIGDIDYENLSNEEATNQEISATLAAFKARAQAEQDRFALVTDSEYWVAACFQTREQKEAFLAGVKLLQHGDKYLDGRLLAQRMGIELPPASVPYNTSAKVDAKFAALVKDL